MSRIGKMPIAMPKGVEVKIDEGRVVVKGPKGTLERQFSPEMSINMEDGF
jgi:large subunit ribosomal protein L6